MKPAKLWFVTAVAMTALTGIAASSALAQGPTVLFLTPGIEHTYLLVSRTIEPRNTTPTQIQSSVATLTGTGFLFELTVLQTPTHITGIYLLLVLRMRSSTGMACNTTGAKEGEVILPLNSLEDVYYKTGSELEVGVVLNMREFSITCGVEKVTVKGSVLGPIMPLNKETTEGEGSILCSRTSGVPVKTEYTNDSGEKKTAKLEVTEAGKTSAACILIGSTETFAESYVIEKNSVITMLELMG
jgi:hypothetical protein